MSTVEKILSMDVSPEFIFDTLIPICPHLIVQGDFSCCAQIAKYIEAHRKPNQRIIFPTRSANGIINNLNTLRLYDVLKSTTGIPDEMVVIMPISYSDDGCCMEPIAPTDIVVWKNRLNLKASLRGEPKSVIGNLLDATGNIPFTNNTTTIFNDLYAELGRCYRNIVAKNGEYEDLFMKAYKVLLLEYTRWHNILLAAHGFMKYEKNMEQEIMEKLVDDFLKKMTKVVDLKTLTNAMAAELRVVQACTGADMFKKGNMPISYRRYLTKARTVLTSDEYGGLLLEASKKAKKLASAINFDEIIFQTFSPSEKSVHELEVDHINTEYISSHLNEYISETLHSSDIILKLPQERVAMLREEYGNKACSNITTVPLDNTEDYQVRYVYDTNDEKFLLFMIRGQDVVYGIGLNDKSLELIQLKGDPRYEYKYTY